MATKWRHVRLPEALAARPERLADEMMESHIAGRACLPNEVCERVPLHFVVERAVSEMEAHKARSNAPRRAKVGS